MRWLLGSLGYSSFDRFVFFSVIQVFSVLGSSNYNGVVVILLVD